MALLQLRSIFFSIFLFLWLVSSTPVELPPGSSAATTKDASVSEGLIQRGGDKKRPLYEDYVPNKSTGKVVTLVYRSDRREPSVIEASGGFQPQGQYAESEDAFRINFHTRFRTLDDDGNPLGEDSGSEGSQSSDYDSDASSDKEPAPDFIAWPSAYVSTAASHYGAIKVNEAVEHYLYIIHAVPSMIINDGIEDEVLAVGGIPWRLVRGWLRIGLEGEFPTLAEVENQMTPNPAYRPNLWEGLAATPDLPSGWDHEHSRQSAINFMNQAGVGTRVGWTGQFPLPFPSSSAAGSSAEPVPGTSQQQSPLDPAVTLSREDVLTAADYLRVQEPCDTPSLDTEARRSTLEAGAAFSRRLASFERDQPDVASQLMGQQQDPSVRAVVARLRSASEPATCHLARECKDYLRRKSEKRAIEGGLGQVCQKIYKPRGLSGSKGKAPGKKPWAPAEIVFYGDFVWPAEAKKAGGFLPPHTSVPGGTYQVDGAPPLDPAVEVDWATELLRTHLVFGFAALDAARKAANATAGFHGVVYAVHATPNMLVSGLDSVAVGGIRWSQVLGWVQIPLDYKLPADNPRERAKMQQHFQAAFQDTNKMFQGGNLFQKNDDYNHNFDRLTTSSDIPDINSPQALDIFMDTHGQAVEWKGRFPLFEPAELVTAQSSTRAKVAKTVPPPHELSFWQKVGHFFESHALALALLPVVAVANLIPGVGEAADALEIAALSTEAVEGIELTELSSEGASELTPLLQGISKVKID